MTWRGLLIRPSGPGEPYVLNAERTGVEFSQYLTSEGYNIIPISREMQLEYG
jgi:hypothetical protein